MKFGIQALAFLGSEVVAACFGMLRGDHLPCRQVPRLERVEAESLVLGSYKIDYSGISKAAGDGRIRLILLVGAARFELPTPCAQGGFQAVAEIAYFQLLTIQ